MNIIDHVLKLLELFTEISSLKLNLNKTQLMVLGETNSIDTDQMGHSNWLRFLALFIHTMKVSVSAISKNVAED